MNIGRNIYEQLNGYLLMRCFNREKYLDELINGVCLRMNSAEKFRENRNKFQGDPNDCAVLLDGDTLPGNLFVGNGSPQKKICKADLKRFVINGYLYCFFALPKAFFALQNGVLHYDDESPYCHSFFRCLKDYSDNSETGECYAALFDAVSLTERIDAALSKEKNFEYCCGFVEYAKATSVERIERFINGKQHEVVFFKDPAYSYQCEFRYFATTPQPAEKYRDLRGINLSDILGLRFKYIPSDWTLNQV